MQKKVYLMRSVSKSVHQTNYLDIPSHLKPPIYRHSGGKKEEFLDVMCLKKLLQGCRLHHLRTSNKIRMEAFGSIGSSSSFSLLICTDLRVLSSTAGTADETFWCV